MHPQFLFAHSYKVDHQKSCSAPLVFTKLHPSYHLNSTQPDHAMWQSPPFKISQPEQDTCHNLPLTKLTNQILPRHHLLHLTHETLTLIFSSPSITMAAAAAISSPATTNLQQRRRHHLPPSSRSIITILQHHLKRRQPPHFMCRTTAPPSSTFTPISLQFGAAPSQAPSTP